MKSSLIISSGYDPEYLRIVEQIVIANSEQGLEPTVFDLAPIMQSPTESQSPLILKMGGYKAPSEHFHDFLSSLGANVLDANVFLSDQSLLSDNALNELKESTTSALFTYFRTDSIDFGNKRVQKVKDRLLKEGINSYLSVKKHLKTGIPAIAYIPNGRFPVQRMAKVALSETGIQIWHYEKGATFDHAFLRPYSPHDRLATQSDVKNILSDVTAAEIEAVAEKWLSDRLPSQRSTNEFTEIWSTNKDKETIYKQDQGRIGFFTSSQDEFLNLGPDWQLHTWPSQLDAFDQLLSHFENNGFRCFLRVHPNLTTKDHACFKREVKGLEELSAKHPDLTIYWHDDPTSSYTLLEGVAGLVVWDSTIGLEASAQGIPVWNCAASYYGMVADTRQVLGKNQITNDNLKPWLVDPFAAKRFIASQVLKDYPLTTNAQKWATWDLKSPPFVVKLAGFARSGGAPTFRDVLLSSIDPWRHRSFNVNRKLLYLKLKKLFNN